MDLPASFEPVPGGRSGQTFVGEVAGTRTVVRVYAVPSPRGVLAHEVDAALLGLVTGLLPVPRVLEVRGATDELPALLLTEHLPGKRADLLLPGLGPADSERLGRRLGLVAATLAGMPMSTRGELVDAALTIRPRQAATTSALVEDLVAQVPGWSSAERDGLTRVAERADDLLDAEPRASLVHGDLDPANVLVDPATLEVTGLVDWERAHAGHPWADLGSLLRPVRAPGAAPYASGVRAAWSEHRGTEPHRDLELARCADLGALLELATRAGAEPGLDPAADAAHHLLTAIARSGDLHVVR